MSFSEAVTACFNKYATFQGRASRPEFWWFYLFSVIVSVVIDVVTNTTGSTLIATVAGLVSLALLLPSLAVGTRRLHDIGRSGWWQLISLTLIGIFVLIYWWAQPTSAESAYAA